MPELPEVETIRKGLARVLPGKRILGVEVRLPKMVSVGPKTMSQYRRNSRARARQFERLLRGKVVLHVKRRAKLLVIELSGGWTMLVHLKMSGQLIHHRRSRHDDFVQLMNTPRVVLGQLPSAYTHVVFRFSDGERLYYNDLRQFGYVRLVRNDDLPRVRELQAFGPEPLERSFTFRDFEAILKGLPNVAVKRVLLDQTRIAGIGNIYADEACFWARVRPTRRVRTLAPYEHQALYRGIRRTLRLALKHAGSSVTFFVTATGETGRMVPHLRVYGREGDSCRRCRTGVMRKIVFQSRGTHFCPSCQPR